MPPQPVNHQPRTLAKELTPEEQCPVAVFNCKRLTGTCFVLIMYSYCDGLLGASPADVQPISINLLHRGYRRRSSDG